MKDKDIYHWRYNQNTLVKLEDSNNGGTTYWCCSCIGIWDAKNKRLVDTYWGSGGNRYFTPKDIKEKLILKYVANLNNLTPCQKYEFNNYADKDCINISHANMSRNGFYIKKNAKPNLAKKRKVIKSHIRHYQNKAEFCKSQVEYYKKQLKEITIDTIAPCDKDVRIY